MSSTELRILLAIIGLIILGLIYYFGTRSKKGVDMNLNTPIEPQIDSYSSDSNSLEPKAQVQSPVIESDSNKIVSLFLHAQNGQQFDWHMIKSAADKAGLEMGEDRLFYRYREVGEQKDLIFIVANMLKPGVFNIDMRTTGLVLIVTLPGVMPALDMWDVMFPVGKRLAELLGGKLTDENHDVFTNQRIASMREEMREFDHKNPNV